METAVCADRGTERKLARTGGQDAGEAARVSQVGACWPSRGALLLGQKLCGALDSFFTEKGHDQVSISKPCTRHRGGEWTGGGQANARVDRGDGRRVAGPSWRQWGAEERRGLTHIQEAELSRRDEGLDVRVREEGRWRGRDLVEETLEKQGHRGESPCSPWVRGETPGSSIQQARKIRAPGVGKESPS